MSGKRTLTPSETLPWKSRQHCEQYSADWRAPHGIEHRDLETLLNEPERPAKQPDGMD